MKGTAAYRGISLILVVGFLAPLCITLNTVSAAMPRAAASVAGDNIDIAGVLPSAPAGSVITAGDVTNAVKTAAQDVWVGVTAPAYTVAVGNLPEPAIATASGTTITLDADAAGRTGHTDPASAPADANAGVDLVTVLAHEIGHVLGFADLAPPSSGPSDLMVGAIAPGVIDAGMTDSVTSAPERDELVALHPLGRMGSAEEVAEAAVWLCSAASFTTGTTLAVDGGFLARG